MKRVTFSLCLSAALLFGSAGCSSELDLPEVREPRCEPRSTTAPARLTIDTSAERYGAVAPCEILVNFAIPQNSSLRSVAGEIEITGPKGDVLYGSAIQTSLEGPGYGTFQNEVRIGPIDGHICRSLTLDLELLLCGDADGNRIECPQIRVKESLVVKKFTVLGTDLNICFDN